jgi:hypothetical protein
MIFDFYGKVENKQKLTQLALVEKSGATWTLGLAKASAELGFKTEFYSICLGVNEDSYDLDFYKKFTDGLDENKKKEIEILKSCKNAGVTLTEKSIDIKFLLNKINNDCIPIVLLDWNIISNGKFGSYNGHFVPIVGYDDNLVYVHQQSGTTAKPYFEIERGLFEKARLSKGTDEEIVFIHR